MVQLRSSDSDGWHYTIGVDYGKCQTPPLPPWGRVFGQAGLGSAAQVFNPLGCARILPTRESATSGGIGTSSRRAGAGMEACLGGLAPHPSRQFRKVPDRHPPCRRGGESLDRRSWAGQRHGDAHAVCPGVKRRRAPSLHVLFLTVSYVAASNTTSIPKSLS